MQALTGAFGSPPCAPANAYSDLALKASSADDKLAFLAQAKLVSNQTFHFGNAHNQMEHFAIKFTDELCRTHQPSFLPLDKLVVAVEALGLLLLHSRTVASTSLPTTMRWAVCVACRIWKPMLLVLATSTGEQSSAAAAAALKQHLWSIKTAILSLPVLDVYAMRFLEVVALSLLRSDPDQDLLQQQQSGRRRNLAGKQAKPMPQFESLKDCPHAHALLRSAELSAEGMLCVDKLLSRLPELQAINSASLIARLRPDSRDRVLRALGKLSTPPPSDHLQQVLKPNLFMLLKAVVPNENALENNPHKDAVIGLLQSLCVLGEEHVSRLLGPLEKKWTALQQKRDELKRKLALYPENCSNHFPTEGLHLLPIDTLAKFLLDNIANLPDQPPPGHRAKPLASKLAMAQSLLPVQLDRLLQQIKAVETGRGGVNLPQAIKDCVAIQVSGDQALKLRESAFHRILHTANKTPQSFLGQFPVQVAQAKLACDVVDDVSLKALLHRELKQANSRDVDEVTLVTALHLEFVADAKLRYRDFLLTVLGGLLETNQTQRIQRIITELPALPTEALDLLLAKCEDPQLFQDYFAILRALVFARPSSRETCVWYLLQQHAVRKSSLVHQKADSRRDAVNLVANQLVNGLGKRWKERICKFAQDTLASMTPDDEEIRDEQGVVAKTLLLVALCATEPFGLLPDFFQTYAELRHRFAEHEELSKLVFGTIDLECDKLWHKLSVEIPAPHALQTFLQYTPEPASDLVFRATEIFCEKNPSAAMLAVLTLVHGGGEAGDEPIVAKDSRFLVPIIGCLSRDEVLVALGRICSECDRTLIAKAIGNIVLERTMDFVDLFLSLARNEIETDKPEGLSVACEALLDKLDEHAVRKAFVEMKKMLEEDQPPSLLMRNAKKCVQLFPAPIKPLALQLLQRAVEREIWALGDEYLWDGFQALCLQCKPDTFELMLARLPDDVFVDFVQTNEPKVKHFKEMLKRAATSLLQDNAKSAPAHQFRPSAIVKTYLGI